MSDETKLTPRQLEYMREHFDQMWRDYNADGLPYVRLMSSLPASSEWLSVFGQMTPEAALYAYRALTAKDNTQHTTYVQRNDN